MENTSKKVTSWIDIPSDSDFSIYNIPFGIFKTDQLGPRCCTAIGDRIVDLAALADEGYFSEVPIPALVFQNDVLNPFIGLGKKITMKIRERLITLLMKDNGELRDNQTIHGVVFHRRETVTMMMPVKVGDYTDFYSSREHATNVGSMFRDPANALLPNWRHLPVAYHGRASSIVVSGTPVIRPKGQFKKNKDDIAPIFAPTEALDFELEVAFVIGKASTLGEAISVEKANEYIFGFLLFNDWSARDIQSWEYVPLGPFLSKNFMSSVSPWIVTTEALAPYKVPGPLQDIQVLPYLKSDGLGNYDVRLEVNLQPEGGHAQRISSSNFKHMYWNVCQQLAHHTVGGCNVCVGDLMASGTISGPARDNGGCMLELTRNGQEPLELKDKTRRRFLDDGDTVTMTGCAGDDGMRVGFGVVQGKVKPSV